LSEQSPASRNHLDNLTQARVSNGMEHRGVEYSVVQGVERGTWRWTVSLGVTKSGLARSKCDAVTKAEIVIDRALWPKKRRLIPQRSV
jgi:hypothetical protein